MNPMPHTALRANRRRGLVPAAVAGFLLLGSLGAVVAGADGDFGLSFLGVGSGGMDHNAAVDENGEVELQGSLEAAYEMRSRAHMLLEQAQSLRGHVSALTGQAREFRGSALGELEAAVTQADQASTEIDADAVKSVNIADRVVVNLEQYTRGTGTVDLKSEEIFAALYELDGTLTEIEGMLGELEGRVWAIGEQIAALEESLWGKVQADYHARITAVMDAKQRVEALVEAAGGWQARLEAALEAFLGVAGSVSEEASGAVAGEVAHAVGNARQTQGEASAAASYTGSLTSTLSGYLSA